MKLTTNKYNMKTSMLMISCAIIYSIVAIKVFPNMNIIILYSFLNVILFLSFILFIMLMILYDIL